MAVVDLTELPAILPPRAPIVGLDLGEKTIGIALSDTRRSIASPRETLRRFKFREDAAKLQAMIEREPPPWPINPGPPEEPG